MIASEQMTIKILNILHQTWNCFEDKNNNKQMHIIHSYTQQSWDIYYLSKIYTVQLYQIYTQKICPQNSDSKIWLFSLTAKYLHFPQHTIYKEQK